MGRPALFLDRDGTLTLPRHHPTSPSQLVLSPGIIPALQFALGLGYRLVVITNQSVVARGLLTEDGLERMHSRLRELFGCHGIPIDGIYACPHHPKGVVPQYAVRCSCRKPAPGLLQAALEDLDIDIKRSCMLGNAITDIQAAATLSLAAVHIGTAHDCNGLPPHWHADNTADGIMLALKELSHA